MSEDPIEYFLTDQQYYGKSDRTLEAYERVLRDFEQFLTGEGYSAAELDAVGRRECMAWIHSLRADHAESTVATYASYVHRFYSYMVQVGELNRNPMTIVTDEMDETIDKDPTRRDLTVTDMRSFLGTIGHPLHRAVILTLLKTGMRVGELCNLDRRDLALDVSPLDDHNPRPVLTDRVPALYVPTSSEIPADREAANKRKRTTIIPVDQELADALRTWLAIAPTAREEPTPLFTSTSDGWGHRLSPEAVRHLTRRYTEPMGWYRSGAGPGENVTPHYFRHFFTTHLRDRTGDRGIVKYLRGDVADDIIDTYTHNWGDRVRELYETHIYTLMSATHS